MVTTIAILMLLNYFVVVGVLATILDQPKGAKFWADVLGLFVVVFTLGSQL